MAHKKNNKKLRKPPRKCVICANCGHNSRTCPTLTKIKNKAPEEKNTGSGSFINVKVSEDIKKSPFVVNISQSSKKENHFEKIFAYQSTKENKQNRPVKIDFARMIQENNKVNESNFVVSSQKQRETLKEEIPKVKKVKTTKNIVTKFKVNRNYNLLPRFFVFKKIFSVLKQLLLQVKQSIFNVVSSFFTAIINLKNTFSFKRFSFSVVVLLLLITVPFPAFGYYTKIKNDTREIVAKSTDAFLALQSSTVSVFNNNIVQAEYDLNSALNSFGSAEEIIDKEYKAMLYIAKLLPIIGDKVKSRQDLLVVGHHLALGNTYLVKGVDEASKENNEINLIDRLTILQQHLHGALKEYNIALADISNVEVTSVPVEYQQSFEDFKILFSGFVDDMNDLDRVIRGIQLIMGGDGFKRYLILFQNTFELRPTGGFVGSYAVVDVQSGKLLNIDVPGAGSYDFQGQLDVYEKPPVPLQLINKRWEFQDSNWFPDFPASAKKMAWFFEHGKKVTVDGVVAINSSVLERLLTVIGPLQNDDYNVLLQSEDALQQLEKEVRSYDNLEENTPKKILSSVLEQIFASLQKMSPDKLINLVTQTHEALSNKEIQLYFNDSYLQNVLQEYGWTGEILETKDNQDYLMVVNANISGHKSDYNITQHVDHQSVIQEDGSVIDTVIITRKHNGLGEEDYYDKPNIDYLRIYVPDGAELLDAGGFIYPDEASFAVPPSWYEDDVDLKNIEQEKSIHVSTGTRVTNEFGKTTFGNWVVTEKGKESKVYFIYKLPFSVFETSLDEGTLPQSDKIFDFANLFSKKKNKSLLSRYSILLQKQSGTKSIISNAVIYPDSWLPVWKEGDSSLELSSNGIYIEKNFENDEIFGIVMEKK